MSLPRTNGLGAVLVLGALGAAAACSESASPNASSSVSSASLLATAFSSAAPGYDQVNSSYDASGNTGSFGPGGGGPGHDGHGGGPGFGGMMGGGLEGEFAGGGGFGPGFGRGAFGSPFGGAPLSTCAYDGTTGRITCAAVTTNGLTVNRYAIYTTASGQSQQAFDTLTNTAVTHVDASGTTTFTPHNHRGFGPGFGHDSSSVRVATATTTVADVSDRTVTGLAAGSTSRTVNGTSSGQESATGKLTDSTAYTSSRTMGDTTTGLVIPIKSGGGAYPTAGTVVRAMSATVTVAGQSPRTASRREVITYDGSATAKIVITQNDTTKTCTMALPRGRLSCS